MSRVNESKEILLFALELAKLKSRDQLINSFVEGVKKLYPKSGLQWHAQIDFPDIKIVIANQAMGYITYHSKFARQKQSVQNLNYLVDLLKELLIKVDEQNFRDNDCKAASIIANKKLEAINESNSYLSALLENNLQALVLLNAEGQLLVFNGTADKFFKLHFNTALEKGAILSELIANKELYRYFTSNFTKALSGDYIERDASDKIAGEEYWYKFQYYPATVKGNKVETVCVSTTDITKLKKSELELILAKQKAEESDRLKTAFLANMSHEIRTPMNGIMGFADMLVRQDTPIDKREYYSKVIINSCQQLLSIVNDILEISKIESGEVNVRSEVLVLNDLFSNVETLFKSKIQDTNLELIIDKGLRDEQSVIESDKKKLLQVLSNLVNNAIKFTKSGHVKTGYCLKGDMLQIYVEDTGIGIPKELHQIIFERFRQGEVETTRKYGGTGLGLSISEKIVEYLGGKIWLESEVDKGTTFYFTVPYKQVKVTSKN